jgi:diguanylate cyclase (GGDEF)-like protein
VQFEKRYRGYDGAPARWVLANVSLLKDAGQPVCHVYQIHDLTDRKQMEHELQRMAYFDPLTGLANRSRLSQDLDRLLADARRRRHRLAVLFLDLDRFKSINDTLGHDAGDVLLRAVADRLRQVLRDSDCIARLGGDEFVVVLPDIEDTAAVVAVTEKIRLRVGGPVSVGGKNLVVTPSIGVSIYPEDGQDSPALLRCADSALYAAKGQGRNRVHFFHTELGRAANARLDLETGLRDAIAMRELRIVLQPIVRLGDGQAVGAEALVRWHRGTQVVPPMDFIPIAEEIGLIVPIGAWVLQEACAAAARWPRPGILHVNVSPSQFREDSLADDIDRILRDTGLAPSSLCLEITESTMLQTTEGQLERLARLRATGVSLSVDDYGTGYSSLAYLKRYAPRSLKIDRYFVQDLEQDASSRAIVSATIAMAHDLGIEVVAEGVETEGQRRILIAEHCDFGQGYMFGKPVPPEAVTPLSTTERAADADL